MGGAYNICVALGSNKEGENGENFLKGETKIAWCQTAQPLTCCLTLEMFLNLSVCFLTPDMETITFTYSITISKITHVKYSG